MKSSALLRWLRTESNKPKQESDENRPVEELVISTPVGLLLPTRGGIA
jgi:hypothetical protein